jgi:hypothetical protein
MTFATLVGFEPTFSTLKGFRGERTARHPLDSSRVIQVSEAKDLTEYGANN